MKWTLLFFSLLFYLLLGCRSQQYSSKELPDKQLVFGNGDGITGVVDTYILLENGQLFHTNSITNTTVELQPLSTKQAEAFFHGIKELSLSDIDFNHPGNNYYFLEEVNENLKNRIVWGAEDQRLSKDRLEFYKELRSHIK